MPSLRPRPLLPRSRRGGGTLHRLLGGAAFPKLIWSAPKDSAWISAKGTLRCNSFTDVALLLHSSESDSIAHDLSSQPIACSSSSSPFTFYFLPCSSEVAPLLPSPFTFRCFARGRRLVAISQREVTNFYPALLDRRHHVLPSSRPFSLRSYESENYTFDVYVANDGGVKLVDFNPWHEEQEGTRAVEFWIVERQRGVRPGLKTAVPYDYLDTGEGSGWDQFLRIADEELRKHPDNLT